MFSEEEKISFRLYLLNIFKTVHLVADSGRETLPGNFHPDNEHWEQNCRGLEGRVLCISAS